MRAHVAILRPPLDARILDGSKRIESRFTRTRQPPFGCVAPGDRLFFKRSAGPFVATAVVSRVLMLDALTPRRVDELAARYNRWIRGDDAFWRRKRNEARYGTLMWLRGVEPTDYRPPYRPQNMRAWYVLDNPPAWGDDEPEAGAGDTANRCAFEATLTAGGIRNGYVRLDTDTLADLPAETLGGATAAEAGERIALHLPDGMTLRTDINAPRRMFRTRRWRHWLTEQAARPGDRLRFTPCGDRAYDVQLLPGDP